jgi:hypothetical protein
MEAFLSDAMRLIDPVIIIFFRLTDHPLLNYFIGSFALAMACSVVGEFTLSLAIRWNRPHIERLKQEIACKEGLSIQAYQAGDHISYQALNKAANDAWGRHFFSMAAHSAGLFWPIPFALAWMNLRFADVSFTLAFPFSLLFGKTVGYPFTFIPLYILSRIVFKYLRPWLPYFSSVQKMLDGDSNPGSLPITAPGGVQIEKTD